MPAFIDTLWLSPGRRRFWSLPLFAAVCFAAISCTHTSCCQAQGRGASPVVAYGFEGIGTGLGTGLAVGYLSTGRHFKSEEWRNLGLGVGLGALSGIGVGMLLGTVDLLSNRPGGIGYFMLRQANVGMKLGFTVGFIVGGVSFLTGGESKSILTGMAWGAMLGTGAGLVFGLIEGSILGVGRRPNRSRGRAENLRFSVGLAATDRALPTPYPCVIGKF